MNVAEPVVVQVRGGVAHVTLSRPNRGNAIDLATGRGLLAAATRCRRERVRAIVLGAEGRSFCVGGDLREFSRFAGDTLAAHLRAVTDALHGALRIFAALDAPLVAAVHGAVARVVEPSRLLDEAGAVAAGLAAGATAAFGTTRRLVRAGLSSELDSHLDREAEAIRKSAVSAEGRAGVAAFLGRRTDDP